MVLTFFSSKRAARAYIRVRGYREKVYSGVRVSIRGINYR